MVIVAKDSEVDKFHLTFKLKKDVKGYQKKVDDTISTYVENFGSLAPQYLKIVRVGSDDTE